MATNCDPINDLSSNFHVKIATHLHKIILDTACIRKLIRLRTRVEKPIPQYICPIHLNIRISERA